MKLEVWTQYGPLNSEPIFKAFVKSLRDAGDTVILNRESDADVAVIWSVLWLGRMRNYKKIWQRYRQANKPVIVLEVGGLRRNKSFKVAINGVNRKADFANQNVDDTRWPLFQHTLKPWQQRGQTIIVLGQHNASEQWVGMPDMRRWFESQVQQIRKHTDRPIQIRPHPRNNVGFDIKKYTNVTLKSEASLCYEVGNHSYEQINNPKMPDRTAWANKLSFTEWFHDEIEHGLPWKRIKARLQEAYI